MSFLELAKSRYSCKSYSAQPVEDEKLATILEAGRWAPTAKNTQEQRIYVMSKPEDLALIDSITPCRYGAPVCLVVAYNENAQYPYPGGKYVSGVEDATIVATHMMLAAEDVGVNSCWLNYFDPDILKERMGLPANEHIVMILDLGYASENGKPLPNHTNKKPLSDTVVYR